MTADVNHPQSAYIHVPFCRHRCGYCNFTLIAGRDDLIDDYLRALEIELSWLTQPRPVQTVFLGGGTPSHLPPAQLQRLMDIVAHWFPADQNCEFTVEANPGDVSDERLEILAAAGVNRLSLGVQSFAASKLHLLERDHDQATIARSVRLARSFDMDISLDLIFGAPDESLDSWNQDLRQAISMNADHISTYGLTIERGTSFWSRQNRNELVRPDEELERAMYVSGIESLGSAGYQHYEVSNFARPGKKCLHNQIYWTGGYFFAAGPGAARYVDGRREVNHRSTTTYLKRVLNGQSPIAESESLSPQARARERLVFGLRRLAGVDLEELASEFGLTHEQLGSETIDRYIELGMLARDGSRVRLTRQGLLISDALWPELLCH